MLSILRKIKKIYLSRLKQRRERAFFNIHAQLKKTYAVFNDSPEGGWIIGKNDAVALYKLIQSHKPKNILELGSGIGASTAVMALAAPEAKILAMEQYEKCVKIARELTPPELLSRTTFIHSPAKAWKDERISKYQYMSIYENIPENFGPFDFVFIDGPGYWLEGDELVELPNGDLVRLLPRILPGAKIYVDGREKAVSIYKRYLSEYLKIITEDTENKYTLFERTATPLTNLSDLKIKDILLEKRKKTAYFN